MNYPMNFISATTDFSTLTHYVPAPYLRKTFLISKLPDKASLLICGLGFYELYINGERVTKGAIAPYVSNPDDIIYYDLYDVNHMLREGENAIGIMLGNGFQNNPGGYTWDFDKARWRGAPKVAMRLDISIPNESEISIESDESFLTAPSPIYNDDFRNGEYYDARNEIPGWNLPGFDDSGWTHAICVPVPKGDAKICEADPIVVTHELKPVSITKQEDGYLYDFGENWAGLCRLQIEGENAQEITLYHGEHLENGKLDLRNICFDDNDYVQKDIYICKGGGMESYTPYFTYHGFQYVFVKGITPEQATDKLLTYLVMNSDIRECGSFNCSDDTINTLQTLARRSTLSNFHYFPTDCPHREKNGWTGDAALSAEHTLINLTPEKSYREWLCNIRKAQREDGSIPGIVPTSGFGYEWGCGPAWDRVLIYLPYYTYIYRGDKSILKENADAIFRYLNYLTHKIRSDGLICFGLGDWCPPGRDGHEYKSPVELTDTIVCMELSEKASYIFDVLDMPLQKDFAHKLYHKLRRNARNRLIDFGTMTAAGRCQTSQAMAIYYNLFEESEKGEAVKVLLDIIHDDNDHMDTGILGGRVLYHVLAQYGHIDLALDMITTTTFPSYGWWLAQGATSLWEDFLPVDLAVHSRNHHFAGDISHFFIRHLSGINYNPDLSGNSLDIKVQFASKIDFAQGHYISPHGEINVRWERKSDKEILLSVVSPSSLWGAISLPKGYIFDDATSYKPVKSGKYRVIVK